MSVSRNDNDDWRNSSNNNSSKDGEFVLCHHFPPLDEEKNTSYLGAAGCELVHGGPLEPLNILPRLMTVSNGPVWRLRRMTVQVVDD
jgi:hypothetical protein